jgi:tetratricopeptide (TPR) repeat protein
MAYFRIFVFSTSVACVSILSQPVLAGPALLEQLPAVTNPMPDCGQQYAPPLYPWGLTPKARICEKNGVRNYIPHNRGIGFEALDLESKACFVPDESYRLLDDIVDDSVARVSRVKAANPSMSPADFATAIGRETGNVLQDKGFQLQIPTNTMGDALFAQNDPGQPPVHIFDCDIGAMIVMTVAEKAALPASLVEITLPSDAGHNYVQWQLRGGVQVNWDTNARSECKTPAGLPSYEGVAMTHEKTIAYILSIRASIWEKQSNFNQALQDYQDAMTHTSSPGVFNNFAWLVATRDMPQRARYKDQALDAAKKAVGLKRSANYLDTLACAYAYAGSYKDAIASETEVVQQNPSQQYKARLDLFTGAVPKDCTGQT